MIMNVLERPAILEMPTRIPHHVRLAEKHDPRCKYCGVPSHPGLEKVRHEVGIKLRIVVDQQYEFGTFFRCPANTLIDTAAVADVVGVGNEKEPTIAKAVENLSCIVARRVVDGNEPPFLQGL